MVDIALRGAAAAARAYLDARDRVGFITYRYRARAWLAPGHGQRHYYRIAEACSPRTGTGPRTPGSPGCPGRRCRPAR